MFLWGSVAKCLRCRHMQSHKHKHKRKGHSASIFTSTVGFHLYIFPGNRKRWGLISFSLLPSCNHFLATFVGSTRSPSRPDGSRDLDEERQMRSNVSERFAFGAHPRSRAHADTRAQRRADLRWTDCSDRVLCCAAPCAVGHRTFKISGYRTLSL